MRVERERKAELKNNPPFTLYESKFCNNMDVIPMSSKDEKAPSPTEMLEDFMKKMQADPLADPKFRGLLDGTIIYGPPYTKKTKKAIAWVKTIMAQEGVEFKQEHFSQFCPLHWMFVWSDKCGWWKISVGHLYE